ncbi:DUF2169 domain-containing protein [Rhodovulum sulfidophilum]|uniref:DUF2169 domain-containing protein n=1 Tax=Rhodovulum sulfidophilum TaxID=35806 RepID=UPI001389A9C0|nr:DUF2169 domain-containing protein [Rhodovulum sulfidophilum]
MNLWALENRTPFAAAALPDRDALGAQHWVVAIRASFGLPQQDGFVRALPEQPAVRLAPEYAPDGSLRHEDDICPFAPCPEFLVQGTIVPEGRAPAQTFLITLGKIEKRAVLHPPAEAVLRRGRWRIEAGDRLVPVTLAWTGTFGGTSPLGKRHEDNPRGTGFGLHEARALPDGTRLRLACLLPPGIARLDSEAARPVGFAPLDRWYPRRAALAGTWDDAWDRTRAPAPPADFNPHFHLCAPRDQWLPDGLKGGEQVMMTGAGPEPFGRFRLPQILAIARITFRGAARELRLRPQRIEIDLDARRLSMLYLASLPCGPFEAEVEKTVLHVRQISGVQK